MVNWAFLPSTIKIPEDFGPAKMTEENHSDSEGAFAVSMGSMQRHHVNQWLVDSGVSSHMTRKKELLMNYMEFEKPEKVGLGDGNTVEAVGVGNIQMNMFFRESSPKRSVLYSVLYVPKLACNLFSVRAAVTKGNTVKCWIRDGEGKVRGMGSLVDKLYRLDSQPLTLECRGKEK